METPKTLAERKKDIQFLMKYAVPAEQMETAAALLDEYDADIIGLNLLYSFYIHLPEGRDDSISGLYLLSRRQGVFLLCAFTGSGMYYLYVVNNEGAQILGTLAEGIIDLEVLDFFGYDDNREVLRLAKNPAELKKYQPYSADADLCPSCHAAEGEYHTLGCPVEICPWCGGQLTYCNCRFARLDVEAMDKAAQIEKLLELLEAAGRIAFKKEQAPGYPSLDDG